VRDQAMRGRGDLMEGSDETMNAKQLKVMVTIMNEAMMFPRRLSDVRRAAKRNQTSSWNLLNIKIFFEEMLKKKRSKNHRVMRRARETERERDRERQRQRERDKERV
jgi:hypothetical protein